MEKYNFKIIEKYWQEYWDKNKSFKTKLDYDKVKTIPHKMMLDLIRRLS